MIEIDKIFKALADSSRRELLDRLHANNGQKLIDLCKGLDMTRQAVTQHLDVLEAANLVSVQWRGREKLHFFNPVPVQEIYQRWIRKFEQQALPPLLQPMALTLESEGGRSPYPMPERRIADRREQARQPEG